MISHLAMMHWLSVEANTILTLRINESFVPSPSSCDIFFPSREGATISYMYRGTGGVTRLAGMQVTLLHMFITQDNHLHNQQFTNKEKPISYNVIGQIKPPLAQTASDPWDLKYGMDYQII